MNYVQYSISSNPDIKYARLFANELSLQKRNKEIRRAATIGHGIEFDIMNSQPHLLLRLIKGIEEHPEENYPMLTRYCKYFMKWRKFYAEYFGLIETDAK